MLAFLVSVPRVSSFGHGPCASVCVCVCVCVCACVCVWGQAVIITTGKFGKLKKGDPRCEP